MNTPTYSTHDREMVEADAEAVVAFWRTVDSLMLREEWESPEYLRRFLRRNAGFSRMVLDGEGRVLGTLLCAHDGCRGYLYNLAVHRDCRGRGVGTVLVRTVIQALRDADIPYCHTYINGSDLLRSMPFLTVTQGRLRNDMPLLTLNLLDRGGQ